MPSAAYGLVALFSVVAIACGVGATLLVGPRRVLAMILPTAAAFLALYWVGHRSGLELGPTIELLGFRVAIVQDLLAGTVAAMVAAVGQRLVLDRWRARGRAPGQAR